MQNQKEYKMNFLQKLKTVFLKNMGYTIVLVAAIVLFVWGCRIDIIRGAITAVAALIAFWMGRILYLSYQNMPNDVTAPVKKTTGAKPRTTKK